jgi:thioredoxin reductase (NADPH)
MGSGPQARSPASEESPPAAASAWCATCDGFFFRDQDIAVVGGGDSAMEEATFLSEFASKVTLIHRRDELRASKIMQERAINEKIEFAAGIATVKSRSGATAAVNELTLITDTTTGETSTSWLPPACSSRSATTRAPSLSPARSRSTTDGYVQVQGRSTNTNLPGVFACGDLVDHTYRQAITAAGSGCAAALDAERYLGNLAHLGG